MAPSLSVVVPTFNRADRLPRCLRSVAAAVPADAELIVADDGSADRTPEVLAELSRELPRLRCVRGPNAGPAANRNRGWRAASADVVAFMDDDCLAEPGWGEALLAALAGDRSLAAVEGKTRPERPLPGVFFHSIESSPGSFLTCNLAVRRAALEHVGGLDEAFPFPAGEDLDLCYRLVEQVGPVGFSPEARVRHEVVEVSARHFLRRVRFDPSFYRLYVRHPARFVAAARTARMPILRRIDGDHPPRFDEIFAYLLAWRLGQGYLFARHGASLGERALGVLTHGAAAAASLGSLAHARQAYRAALAERRSGHGSSRR